MQKLESLGQLTGGLAHDFNNLLMVIQANLELARKHTKGNERLSVWLGRAMEAADRGAALTKRMLAFARRQDLKPENISLSDVVRGMAEMMSRSLDPTVRIAVDIPSDLPSVRIDRNQFELALLNLGLNARDAMPSGGTLTITARPVDGERIPEKLERGSYVQLSVADNGDGDGRRHVEAGFGAFLHDQAGRQRFRAWTFHGSRTDSAVRGRPGNREST